MNFNLLEEKWIPIERRSGKLEKIAPFQLTDAYTSDPVLRVRAPRVDFDGVLTQFLIGLLQTAKTPEDEREWRRLFDTPASPDELSAIFAPLHRAFELFGNGPRFMQDLSRLPDGPPIPIESLLVGTPGDQGIKKNTDLFIKRDGIASLCAACAATALLSCQTNAWAGGAGYRTGIRGGGPVTALPLGRTLWETVALSILPAQSLSRIGNLGQTDLVNSFPWLGPTRTSEDDEKILPQQMHPCHVFWGMPRRLLLVDSAGKGGVCSLCGGFTPLMVQNYKRKPYGMYYSGANWLHPLSPYRRFMNKEEPQPINMQPGGLSYRDAIGVAVGMSLSDDSEVLAPLVVDLARKSPRMERTSGLVWAFGVDFDNAKARGYYEHYLPLLSLEAELLPTYRLFLSRLVAGAYYVVGQAKTCVRQALFSRPTDHAIDASTFKTIESQFWSDTESAFWNLEQEVRRRLIEGAKADAPTDWYDELAANWIAVLGRWARNVFDTYSQSASLAALEPGRIAHAWKRLQFALSIHNNTLRKELGLPITAKAKAKTKTIVKKQKGLFPDANE